MTDLFVEELDDEGIDDSTPVEAVIELEKVKSSALESRRRIEELLEKKRLREELGEDFE